jgi:hypothetical protein
MSQSYLVTTYMHFKAHIILYELQVFKVRMKHKN